MKDEATAVAVVKETSVSEFISQAIAQNLPVETMERLFSLRERVKAEQAREGFIGAMAKFQSECPVIVKTKEVSTNSGQHAYSYAPIESIVAQVKEALRNNGFSYSTNMKMLENAVEVSVKVQHVLGHSEVTEMTVPLGTKTGVMSASQVVAAASTFAKRYAFLNAFGILTGDEDNDAREVVEKPAGKTIPEELSAKVKNAKTEEELKTIWMANKGLGKAFAKLVTGQRDFIRSVKKGEVAEANPQ